MNQGFTPGGAQTLSKQPARFGAAYPGLAMRGAGSQLYCADGRWYTDWIMGLAAMPLGYGHPAIDAVALKQLPLGVSFSLPTALEESVAEQVCHLVPCAEQVRFVKTGSEATEAAIRVARLATGRSVVAVCDTHYHGWHSWSAAAKPEHPGVPWPYAALVRTFRYNDLASVEDALTKQVFEAGPGHAAALIMEPVTFEPPAPGFLAGVRDLCTRHGALLIFDEMVTGFRWPGASAQAYYGVTPDLACFGKGLANGWPLACLVGPRSLLRHAWAVSGTFGGEAVSLAAAAVAVELHREPATQQLLWETGQRVQRELQALIDDLELPALIEGLPPRLKLTWRHEDANRLMSLWLQQLVARGVLVHPGGWTGSTAHGVSEVAKTTAAAQTAFVACRHALSTGDWAALKLPLIEPIQLRG